MNIEKERSDLIAMVSKIMNAEGTEKELDDLLRELIQITSMQEISDMIFYPTKEMSAAEIVDAALNNKFKLLS